MNKLFPLFLFLGAALAFGACEKKEDLGYLNPIIEIEDERKLGKVLRDAILLDDQNYIALNRLQHQACYDYLNARFIALLNTPLVRSRQFFDWEIIILQDDSREMAFTLPGGKIFVYTGLLKYLSDESELMAVLAQEIAYADRSSESGQAFLSEAAKRLKAEFGSKTLVDVAYGNLESSFDTELATQLENLAYDPEVVAAADAYTIDLLCPFNYDAKGLAHIIERVESSDAEGFEWFSIRPAASLGARADNLTALAVGCGDEGATFPERYAEFVGELP